MTNLPFLQAIQVAERLYKDIDSHFHHGSCDGTMFIGPADKELLQEFWNKNRIHLSHFSSSENKKQLEEFRTSSYNVYYYYIDDNDWSSLLYAYDSAKNDLDLICCWGGDY